MQGRQLKIVRLLEPEMCLECRFAKYANVEAEDGSRDRMIHCTRKDCDNWDTQGAQRARDVVDEDL